MNIKETLIITYLILGAICIFVGIYLICRELITNYLNKKWKDERQMRYRLFN
jgi:hypothetical protein